MDIDNPYKNAGITDDEVFTVSMGDKDPFLVSSKERDEMARSLGGTFSKDFYRDSDGQEYIYDANSGISESDWLLEKQSQGVGLTKAGADERPSNYIYTHKIYNLGELGNVRVREDEEDAFRAHANKQGWKPQEISTRRWNGVDFTGTTEALNNLQKEYAKDGIFDDGQLMALGATEDMVLKGKEYQARRVKSIDTSIAAQGKIGFVEHEARTRGLSTIGREAKGAVDTFDMYMTEVKDAVSLDTYQTIGEMAEAYGGADGLERLKNMGFWGRTRMALWGGLTVGQAASMSDEELYDWFKQIRENQELQQRITDLRGLTTGAKIGSSAVDMAKMGLEFTTATLAAGALIVGTGGVGALGAAGLAGVGAAGAGAAGTALGAGLFVAGHAADEYNRQIADRMFFNPVTGRMEKLSEGRRGGEAFAYTLANPLVEYAVEKVGGKAVGGLLKPITKPMKNLATKAIGREMSVVLGLTPGVVKNWQGGGLFKQTAMKVGRAYHALSRNSWGKVVQSGIRGASPSGIFEELNEEALQNFVEGAFNLRGEYDYELGKIGSGSMLDGAKGVLEVYKSAPEFAATMMLYNIGAGAISRGTSSAVDAYGNKATLREALKWKGYTKEQLKGMSRDAMKEAFRKEYMTGDPAAGERVKNEMLASETSAEAMLIKLQDTGAAPVFASNMDENGQIYIEVMNGEGNISQTIEGEEAVRNWAAEQMGNVVSMFGESAVFTSEQQAKISKGIMFVSREEMDNVRGLVNGVNKSFELFGNDPELVDAMQQALAMDYVANTRYMNSPAYAVLKRMSHTIASDALRAFDGDRGQAMREFNKLLNGGAILGQSLDGVPVKPLFTAEELKTQSKIGDGNIQYWEKEDFRLSKATGKDGAEVWRVMLDGDIDKTPIRAFSTQAEALTYINKVHAKRNVLKERHAFMKHQAEQMYDKKFGNNGGERQMIVLRNAYENQSIYDQLVATAQRHGGEEAANQVLDAAPGAYLADGTFVIFTDNCDSIATLAATISHEGTHTGIDALFELSDAKGREAFVAKTFPLLSAGNMRLKDRFGRAITTESFKQLSEREQTAVLNETLAYLAEVTMDKPGLMGRITGAVADLFGKDLPYGKMSSRQRQREVQRLLSSIYAHVNSPRMKEAKARRMASPKVARPPMGDWVKAHTGISEASYIKGVTDLLMGGEKGWTKAVAEHFNGLVDQFLESVDVADVRDELSKGYVRAVNTVDAARQRRNILKEASLAGEQRIADDFEAQGELAAQRARAADAEALRESSLAGEERLAEDLAAQEQSIRDIASNDMVYRSKRFIEQVRQRIAESDLNVSRAAVNKLLQQRLELEENLELAQKRVPQFLKDEIAFLARESDYLEERAQKEAEVQKDKAFMDAVKTNQQDLAWMHHESVPEDAEQVVADAIAADAASANGNHGARRKGDGKTDKATKSWGELVKSKTARRISLAASIEQQQDDATPSAPAASNNAKRVKQKPQAIPSSLGEQLTANQGKIDAMLEAREEVAKTVATSARIRDLDAQAEEASEDVDYSTPWVLKDGVWSATDKDGNDLVEYDWKPLANGKGFSATISSSIDVESLNEGSNADKSDAYDSIAWSLVNEFDASEDWQNPEIEPYVLVQRAPKQKAYVMYEGNYAQLTDDATDGLYQQLALEGIPYKSNYTEAMQERIEAGDSDSSETYIKIAQKDLDAFIDFALSKNIPVVVSTYEGDVTAYTPNQITLSHSEAQENESKPVVVEKPQVAEEVKRRAEAGEKQAIERAEEALTEEQKLYNRAFEEFKNVGMASRGLTLEETFRLAWDMIKRDNGEEGFLSAEEFAALIAKSKEDDPEGDIRMIVSRLRSRGGMFKKKAEQLQTVGVPDSVVSRVAIPKISDGNGGTLAEVLSPEQSAEIKKGIVHTAANAFHTLISSGILTANNPDIADPNNAAALSDFVRTLIGFQRNKFGYFTKLGLSLNASLTPSESDELARAITFEKADHAKLNKSKRDKTHVSEAKRKRVSLEAERVDTIVRLVKKMAGVNDSATANLNEIQSKILALLDRLSSEFKGEAADVKGLPGVVFEYNRFLNELSVEQKAVIQAEINAANSRGDGEKVYLEYTLRPSALSKTDVKIVIAGVLKSINNLANQIEVAKGMVEFVDNALFNGSQGVKSAQYSLYGKDYEPEGKERTIAIRKENADGTTDLVDVYSKNDYNRSYDPEAADDAESMNFKWIGPVGASALDQHYNTTSRMDGLTEAKALSKSGMAAQKILNKTGWQRDPIDGQWKYWMGDDFDKSFRDSVLKMFGVQIDTSSIDEYFYELINETDAPAKQFLKSMLIAELRPVMAAMKDAILRHKNSQDLTLKDFGIDEYFIAYPELANAKVRFTDKGSNGGYNPKTNTFLFNLGSILIPAQKTKIHETQHFIQQQEKGWAGSAPSSQLKDKTLNRLKQLIDSGKYTGHALAKLKRDYEKALLADENNVYRRTAGEVIARAAANIAIKNKHPERILIKNALDVPLEDILIGENTPALVEHLYGGGSETHLRMGAGSPYFDLSGGVYGDGTMANYEARVESGANTLRHLGEGVYDKVIQSRGPLFRAIRSTLKRLGVPESALPDEYNVEASMKNVHGKIRMRAEQIHRKYLDPLRKLIKDHKLDTDRLDEYLYAKFAPERNKLIKERTAVVDPNTGQLIAMEEDGSGMSDAEASRIMQRFANDPKREAYDKAMHLVWEMNGRASQLAVDYGFVTVAQRKTWMKLSPHYVPLKDLDSKHFTIRRSAGRSTKAASPLAASVYQAQEIIRRGELARCNQTLAKFINHYGNGEGLLGARLSDNAGTRKAVVKGDPVFVPNGSEAEVELMKAGVSLVETPESAELGGKFIGYDDIPNELRVVVQKSMQHAPNVATYWENGVRKYIVFDKHNAEAMKIADAVNNSNLLSTGDNAASNLVRRLTRWKADISTTLNPKFVLRNMGADFFNTSMILMTEGKYKELGAFAKNYFKAMKTVRDFAKGKQIGDSELGKYYLEARENGMLTGVYGEGTFKEAAHKLSRDIKRMQGGSLRQGWEGFKEFMETIGSYPEQGARLAVYAAMRKRGMSPAQAAQYGREVTVDFNAKGEWTPVINTLYMFSNAGAQGVARAIKALQTGASDRGGGVQGYVRAAMPGIMVSLALGYLSSMMMDAAGDDDEEDGVNTSKYARLPEHVKSNNVAIPFVGDTYIQLPTRGMWQSFTNLGTLIYDFQTGRKDAEEVVAGFTTSMRDATDFIGGNAPTAGQWLAPTIFDPLVQVLEGKDWAGREIYRKDFGQSGANAHRGKNATGSLYKILAEGLNSATGGDKVKSGLIDLYPETYQLFTEFMLGSLAQLALNDVPNTLQTVAGAREAKANDLPAIGGVLRQSSDVESQYYTEFAKFDKVYKELKGYRKERMTAKTAEERQKWRDREQALIAKYPWARSADTLNAIAGRITKLKKQTNERNEASIDAQIEKQAKNFLRFIQKGQ